MTDWTPERIRALKSALGLSFEGMGRAIDVKGRTVRSWVYEADKRQPGKHAIAGLERLDAAAKKVKP